MSMPVCSTSHSMPCIGYSPSTKVASNMMNSDTRKMTTPHTLCVTKWSIRWVKRWLAGSSVVAGV